MPEFSLTDDVGKPVAGVTVDWTSASALFKYLKSEVLHLIVVPDFLARKDLPLAQAARDPIEFQLKAANKFQLGNVKPEIDVKPGVQIKLRANTMAGPANTGYAGLALTGSLGLGVSGSAGDLTFGLGESSSITIEYLKAFTMDDRGPTLGEAVGRMISSYVIPRDIADLRRLQANDVCTVSGKGSLKVSGGFTIATPVNPLA